MKLAELHNSYKNIKKTYDLLIKTMVTINEVLKCFLKIIKHQSIQTGSYEYRLFNYLTTSRKSLEYVKTFLTTLT